MQHRILQKLLYRLRKILLHPALNLCANLLIFAFQLSMALSQWAQDDRPAALTFILSSAGCALAVAYWALIWRESSTHRPPS